MIQRRRFLTYFVMGGGLFSLIGSCKDMGNEAPPNVNVAELSFATHIQPIFNANCAVPGCHVTGGAGPMSLVVGVSYGNLVEVNAITGPCAGDRRVKRSDATASALIKRLEGTCGQQMPLGGTPLSVSQIQLIRDWINQGANNN